MSKFKKYLSLAIGFNEGKLMCKYSFLTITTPYLVVLEGLSYWAVRDGARHWLGVSFGHIVRHSRHKDLYIDNS